MLLLVALVACERAGSTENKPAPLPTPVKPDPSKQARDEFELLPSDYALGTHRLYSRGDFLPRDTDIKQQFDEGDFIGRLRTLFGATAGDEYVLRHKATGYVITAYSGTSGPSFGGGARYQGALPPADPKALMQVAFNKPEDPAIAARKAADPVLANGTASTDFRTIQEYARHESDAEAGPELAGAIRRLNALLDAVPPADWQTTRFYDEGPGVYRIGTKNGHSFNVELPATEAFDFLAKNAESRDPNEHDELGGIPFDADSAVLSFYMEHEDELRDQRPRALAAYKRLLAEAKSSSGDLHASLLEQAHNFAGKLHVTP